MVKTLAAREFNFVIIFTQRKFELNIRDSLKDSLF